MYFNFSKPEAPIRWESLMPKTPEMNAKKGNMHFWWELHDKYEDDLSKHAPS